MRRLATLIALVMVVAGCATDSAPSTTADSSMTTVALSTPSEASSSTASVSTSTTPSTTASTTSAAAVPATPPTLEILDPKPGLVVASPSYVFRGDTDPGCTVSVGGRYFADVDEEGKWSLELMLRSGWNATTFTATDDSGLTSVRQVRVVRRLSLAEAIVGEWVGTAAVPKGWLEIGEVWFEFRSDGTYSVRNGALYSGDDFDTAEKTYQVWEDDDPATTAVEGTGQIALTWDSEAKRYAQLANFAMESDQLRFELWDRGRGPIVYSLRPAPPNYCVEDPWEGMDSGHGTNHGRPMMIADLGDDHGPFQAFDGILCPGDRDIHHFYVEFFPSTFPPGETFEIPQIVTVTSHGGSRAPIDVTLYKDVSDWKLVHEYSEATVEAGVQSSIVHVWVVDFESMESWSVGTSWAIKLESEDDRAHGYTVEIELIDPRD